MIFWSDFWYDEIMVIGDGKNSGVMMLMMLKMLMVKMMMINLQVMTNALSRSLVNFARGGRTVESAARKFPVSRCFHLSLLSMYAAGLKLRFTSSATYWRY